MSTALNYLLSKDIMAKKKKTEPYHPYARFSPCASTDDAVTLKKVKVTEVVRTVKKSFPSLPPSVPPLHPFFRPPLSVFPHNESLPRFREAKFTTTHSQLTTRPDFQREKTKLNHDDPGHNKSINRKAIKSPALGAIHTRVIISV